MNVKNRYLLPLSLLIAGSPAAAEQPAHSTDPTAPYARQPANVVVSVDPADRREQDEWGYADAVIDGDHIWLSGAVAILRVSETMADQEAAYERLFRGLQGVLERTGADFDGVVEMTTFHTDLPTQIEAFKRVKHRYVRGPFPAWTAIDIDRLVPDRGLVEVKLIARRKPAPK